MHDATGTDITATPPNYVTAFDSTNGSLTLFTVSTDDKGFQTVQVKSWILLNPTDRPSDNVITFTFEILIDPCLDSNELYPVTIDDMYFKI